MVLVLVNYNNPAIKTQQLNSVDTGVENKYVKRI